MAGFHNKYDADLGRSVPGLYYALSDDLINWSASVLVMESAVAGWGHGGIYYPSLIDHDDTSRNFERPGREAYLYYTRWNSGVYDRDLCRTPIRFSKPAVSMITDNIPGAPVLFQNSPNPFNPRTRISYTIQQAGMINLKVYDAGGREVETLLNEHQESGHYTVDFRPDDLPSSVYFYQLQVGREVIATRKMVLLR